MIVIGVMGGGTGSSKTLEDAYQLGRLIAEQGWVLLNGGRNAGVMEASAQGAKQAGGLTVGVLPDAGPEHASAFIDIPVCTGMGSARNAINVLSSRVVVACAGGMGTISEVALAIKSQRPVVLLNFDPGHAITQNASPALLTCVKTPEQAIEKIKLCLNGVPWAP